MAVGVVTKGRRYALGALVAAGAGLAGAGVWYRWGRSPADDGAAAALWDLQFDRPEGGKLVMANFRGHPLVINFWATWCAPCIRELPALQRFHHRGNGQGWQVIALAVDQPAPVLEFVARFKLDLPVALAGVDGLEWQRTMGNTSGALPFSVLLDARGHVVHTRLGESSYDDLLHWTATAPAGG